MFHKVLKSGFKVENCRLSTADRLKKYLTVMSIVACRMFMITLIARESPNTSCQKFLSNDEWKVLFAKTTGRTRLHYSTGPTDDLHFKQLYGENNWECMRTSGNH